MPLDLFKLPGALTSLLGVRAEGRLPALLADQYIGNLDLTELFLLPEQTWIFAAAAAAVNNAGVLFPEFLVPQNEYWYVWRYDVQTAPMGAGVSLAMCPWYKFTSLDGNALSQARLGVGAAVNYQLMVASAETGFWMRPGYQLGFFSEQLTGAVNVSGHAFVTRLRAS